MISSYPSMICCDVKEYTSLSISNDFTVYSFGFSSFYGHGHKKEIILYPTKIKSLINIKLISCGYNHNICVDFEGICFSFGDNTYGQLGIGTDKIKKTYKPQQINISPIRYVSSGTYHSICLSEDNLLYVFGYNGQGQLGLGNNETNYNSPQLIPDLNNIELVQSGANHIICKTYDGDFFSWGNNCFGQLGHNNTTNCFKPIKCIDWPENIINIKTGFEFQLLLTSEGKVYSLGNNTYGQLGLNENEKSIKHPRFIKDLPDIKRIECGYNYSMCIDYEDSLWLFGYNSNGELGLRDKYHRFKPVQHPIVNIRDISSGGYHTFIKTFENKIYAFGSNNKSQLGIKTVPRQLTPVRVFEGKEDIWCSFIGKSKAKSARK